MSHYLSDCRSVYNVKADEGYPSMQLACTNCKTPQQFYTHPCSGYSMGGNCNKASSQQDGKGYISDGTNYYYMPIFTPGTYPSSSMACSNGVSHLNGYPVAGSCGQSQNVVEHFEPPSTYEPYSYSSKGNNLHLIVIIILLFVLIVLLCLALILRLNKKI